MADGQDSQRSGGSMFSSFVLACNKYLGGRPNGAGTWSCSTMQISCISYIFLLPHSVHVAVADRVGNPSPQALSSSRRTAARCCWAACSWSSASWALPCG